MDLFTHWNVQEYIMTKPKLLQISNLDILIAVRKKSTFNIW